MIKLSGLNEVRTWKGDGPAWYNTVWEHVLQFNIPLTPTIMEKLIGKIPINTFHITTLMGIKSLKKMESKKSSISSFNAISKDSDIAKGLGIQTKGGVLVHLKGNMVAAQRGDFNSYPGSSGRRWVSYGQFNGWVRSELKIDFGVELGKELYKSKIIVKYKNAMEERENGRIRMGSVLNRMRSQAPKEDQQEAISDYIDATYRVMLKHKNHVRKTFGKKVRSLGEYDEWNEIVVNEIQFGDIIVTPKVWKHMSDSDKQNLEKMTKGGVIYAKSVKKDISKFVNSRGGNVK